MGFIPSPSCSLADPELGAGHPKPDCLLNDPCLGLAWPEIPQGKEETQKPHSLRALPHPGGVAQAGDATSHAGSGGGMGNGRQGHRWKHCVGGAAGEHQLPGGAEGGALETESSMGGRPKGVKGWSETLSVAVASGRQKRRREEARLCPSPEISLPSQFLTSVLLSLWVPVLLLL